MFRKNWLPFVFLVAFASALAACGGGGDKALDTAGLNLGREASTLVKNATEALQGINSLESAQAALPKLQDMDTKFAELAKKAGDLSPESKDALAGMVKGALPALEAQVSKLEEMPGVGDAIMPTVNSLLAKVRQLQ